MRPTPLQPTSRSVPRGFKDLLLTRNVHPKAVPETGRGEKTRDAQGLLCQALEDEKSTSAFNALGAVDSDRSKRIAKISIAFSRLGFIPEGRAAAELALSDLHWAMALSENAMALAREGDFNGALIVAKRTGTYRFSATFSELERKFSQVSELISQGRMSNAEQLCRSMRYLVPETRGKTFEEAIRAFDEIVRLLGEGQADKARDLATEKAERMRFLGKGTIYLGTVSTTREAIALEAVKSNLFALALEIVQEIPLPHLKIEAYNRVGVAALERAKEIRADTPRLKRLFPPYSELMREARSTLQRAFASADRLTERLGSEPEKAKLLLQNASERLNAGIDARPLLKAAESSATENKDAHTLLRIATAEREAGMDPQKALEQAYTNAKEMKQCIAKFDLLVAIGVEMREMNPSYAQVIFRTAEHLAGSLELETSVDGLCRIASGMEKAGFSDDAKRIRAKARQVSNRLEDVQRNHGRNTVLEGLLEGIGVDIPDIPSALA